MRASQTLLTCPGTPRMISTPPPESSTTDRVQATCSIEPVLHLVLKTASAMVFLVAGNKSSSQMSLPC